MRALQKAGGTNQSRAVKEAPLGWKWCSVCGHTKKLSEFGKIKGRPEYRCKECRQAMDRSRRKIGKKA